MRESKNVYKFLKSASFRKCVTIICRKAIGRNQKYLFLICCLMTSRTSYYKMRKTEKTKAMMTILGNIWEFRQLHMQLIF